MTVLLLKVLEKYIGPTSLISMRVRRGGYQLDDGYYDWTLGLLPEKNSTALKWSRVRQLFDKISSWENWSFLSA